jgi:hypothetical protein
MNTDDTRDDYDPWENGTPTFAILRCYGDLAAADGV